MTTEKFMMTFTVDKELLEKINDYRFEKRIDTKSEAIRKLIIRGFHDWEREKRASCSVR